MKNKHFAWASLLCLLLCACNSRKIDPRLVIDEPTRDAAAFVRAFFPTSTTYIAVYNRERKLRMVSKGEVDVHEIHKSLTD
jgi:hypothetical protein